MAKNKKDMNSNSDNNKKTTSKKNRIPIRLNFLFFIVFILFTALVVKLSYLQIGQQDKFKTIVEKGQTNTVEENAPRGYIYDSSGKVLVSNKANQAILYTRSSGMTAEKIREVSEGITNLITITPDELSDRDKKDYILSDPEELKKAQASLTVTDKLNSKGEQLSQSDLYTKMVDKMDLSNYTFTKKDEQIASVFKKINASAALQQTTIKNQDVTAEEIAKVGENATNIPGLSTGMDWEREYKEDDPLTAILGTVSTEKQGIPEEKVDEYLKKGYNINDRVGLSYLEEEYESDLKGKKGTAEVVTDKNQQIVSKTETTESEKGDNLVLTINLDFQKKVEAILEENYKTLIANGKADLSEGAYAVVTEPSTGNVLAMAGINHDIKTGELTEDVLGTINKSFVPGSSIKAATLMSGYENGIISGNQQMVDEPLTFEGGIKKSSVFNPYGQYTLTASQALEVSSNVYMMKIALAMMGTSYTPNMTLPIKTDVYNELRSTYAEFGLGVSTGIDLPQEGTGFINETYKDDDGNYIPGVMGTLLDLSYGNYDTYTPMQLNQYVSTVANKGTRVAPHVVKGIYGNNEDGGLGELKKEIEPKVLNKIEGKDAEFDIIQDGMKAVVNGSMGTGTALQGADMSIAAKTGTAETFAKDANGKTQAVVNSTIVGYAPADNPEIAVSVVFPELKDEKEGMNTATLKQIVNAYVETKNATN